MPVVVTHLVADCWGASRVHARCNKGLVFRFFKGLGFWHPPSTAEQLSPHLFLTHTLSTF